MESLDHRLRLPEIGPKEDGRGWPVRFLTCVEGSFRGPQRVLKRVEPMLPRTSGTSRVYHSWLVVAYYMAHTLLLGFSKRDVRRR